MKNILIVVLLVVVAVGGTYLITSAQQNQYTFQPAGQPVIAPVQDLNPVQPTPLPAPVVATPVTVEVIREVQVVVTATPRPIILPTLRVDTRPNTPGGNSGGGR